MRTKINEELDRALDALKSDIDRVEIWLGALKGFCQPLPDYETPYRRLKIPAKDVTFTS